jgi:hypothetical protein
MTSYHLNFGKFEVGPYNSVYSFNQLEGNRFRFGGRTTLDFSKRFFVEGYTAFGTLDQKFKYRLTGLVSLTDRNYVQFPLKAVKLSIQKDVLIPGQGSTASEQDNILLSFRRGPQDKWLLQQNYNLSYIQEFKFKFAINAGFRHLNQTPLSSLADENPVDNTFDNINNFKLSEFKLSLRWAPGEELYQGRARRMRVSLNKYPIFSLKINHGVKDLLGGDYSYTSLVFNFRKRFFLSPVGFGDVTIESGKILGTVPYTMLFIPPANQSYLYEKRAYNLMNFLEFVNDEYASIIYDHYFNGFFLNKIPVVKKLKLRELASIRALYGNLSPQNQANDNLNGPKNEIGAPLTLAMGPMPYIEGSIGFGNIFKVWRVDLVKRFTYLDNPNISTLGIRINVQIDF